MRHEAPDLPGERIRGRGLTNDKHIAHGVRYFIVTKVKTDMEKKEEINYNICHTHPGHDVGCRLRFY
ncbi:MAG TPA: hypothetical protein ENH52_07765 [Nitrospirae bacterium]|nr:hypothetical protein [Nitrospirota bacterium]